MARRKAEPDLLTLRLTIHLDKNTHGPIYEAMRSMSPARAAVYLNSLLTELAVLRGLMPEMGARQLLVAAPGGAATNDGEVPPAAAAVQPAVKAATRAQLPPRFNMASLAEKYPLEIDNDGDD